MKIYFAGPEEFNLWLLSNILLSFWDLGPGLIPFRKKTFEVLKSNFKKEGRADEN